MRWVARFHQASLFGSMVKLAQMIERHLAGILAHWKWGVTNGSNSVFSATKRNARSDRSTTHLIAMLYFTAGKLRLPSSNSTENSGEPQNDRGCKRRLTPLAAQFSLPKTATPCYFASA